MGYGTRALELLQQYYEGRIPSLTETDDTQPQLEAENIQSEVFNKYCFNCLIAVILSQQNSAVSTIYKIG